MEQKVTPLEALFRELQSTFNKADVEEKALFAVKFQEWAEQQRGLLGAEKERNQSKARREPIPQDIKTLVEGEIRLKGITENIEQVIWVRDQDTGRVLYASPAFETVWGRSRESLYADPYLLIESVHPEDRVQVMAASPRSDRKPLNQIYRILRPDESLRWISVRTFFIPGEVGRSYYLVCIAQDITDQKEVELILRKALDRSRELFTISHKMSLARKPEAVLKALMSAHELRSARRAAVLFFDFPESGPTRGVELTASWQSSSHLTVSHPGGKDVPLWLGESSLYEEPALWELFQSNKPMVFTEIDSDPRITPRVRVLLSEGQIHTLAAFPLVALGDWLGCLLIFYTQEHHFAPVELRHLKVLIDQATITLFNLRLLEVEEESRHEAERANEIKTRFLAMISHELRTPLTSIVGFTTTLLAEDVVWEPEEQRDFIQTIQREANRLKELIDHLLDLSRLEAGRLPISQEIHSLPEILEDVLPQFHSLKKDHTLTVHLPAILPPVYVDPKRIAQVLVNLVGNASTYAPEGTEITISASVRGGFMQVNVADQGPGIPPEEHKKVFEAFRRGANQVEGLGKGAGLGLAICKGLVEAHGGHIWIKKKTTPGATISFTIPLGPLNSPGTPAGKEELSEEER
jgi:PAS domain S-box-containing protein